MDSDAINPAKGPDIRPVKPPASSGKPTASAPVGGAKSAPDDTVSLSPAGKQALETSAPTPENVEGLKNQSADPGNNNSRKYQVTEGHDVILKIVDNKTREVVKQIPSEEEIRLKNAIRNSVEDISTENNPTEDLI